ncbi:phosphotransferase enzyme family protein [Paludisphaera borealis]|uniref:Aminoglycoside phosphotransferase domain-containing protein n=1 Tax=Paludisphaera borealis TaxID=1387353 RepID=A0A1U7CLJ8_9BACT|nr:aminoglycoside phosphotransferase family protein [Paludisphaera borealis]APW59787.1 hypothetical protein BSF38_01243 [Paludisphaera borealis]
MTSDAPKRLLERYGRDLQPVDVLRPLGGFGGHSGSRLWRYTSASGERLVRAWPEAGQRRERIETIHGWLREAGDLAFVPLPILALDGRTVQELQGTCWEVTPWLAGSADASRPPRVERVRAAFRALGEFHVRLAKDASLGRSPGLILRCEELERLTAGGFDKIEADLNSGADDPCRPTAREWLSLARRTAPSALGMIREASRLASPLQPCLRDARPEHFLFEGDRVTGLVDFGAMDVETVAADLARLLGEWLPLPAGRQLRAEGIKAYMEFKSLNPEHLLLAGAFEAAADVLIGERWIRWRFREHRRFDDQMAVADGLTRGLGRLRGLSARLG